MKSAEQWAVDYYDSERASIITLVEAVRAELRAALAVEFEKQAREGSSGLFRAADIARTFEVEALAHESAKQPSPVQVQSPFCAHGVRICRECVRKSRLCLRCGVES